MHKKSGFALLMAAAILFLVTPMSQAQAVAQFDVPSQPLAAALRAIGSQAGVNVLFDPPLVEGLDAPALKAELTTDQAFARLLAGSGLKHRFLDDRTVMVIAAPAEPTAKAPETRMLRLAQADISQNTQATDASSNRPSSTSSAGEADESMALEGIVVTAQKVSSDLQETPITVSTVSGEDLAALPVGDIRSALQDVPSIAFKNNGSYGVSVIARGISPGIQNGQEGVSSLFDGVYSASSIGWRVGYYDVSRIEVLLGPQGTLYGRNAEGGVFNVITNDPTQIYEGNVTAGVGNYGAASLQGMVNVPISDSLSLRVAAAGSRRDGYLSNGQDDEGTYGIRGKLLYQPSEKFSVLLAAEQMNIDHKGVASVPFFVDGTRSAFTVPYTSKQYYRQKGYRTSARIDADAGIGNLTLMPAYYKTDEADDLINNILPGSTSGFSEINYGLGALEEQSLETRLTSYDTSPIRWIVGAYLYDSEDVSPRSKYRGSTWVKLVNDTITLAPNALASYQRRTQQSEGYFAQMQVPLTDKLSLIGGLRYSEDRSTFFDDGNANPPGNQRATWSHTDYRAGAQYQVSPTSMVYATYASGYRPGGFSPAPPYPSYDIESVDSYEFGAKNEFFDRTLRVNAGVYHYDYEGYQQLTFQPCGFPGGPVCTGSTGVNLVITNVEKVTVDGGELSVQYRLTPNDRLGASMAYNSSRFDSPISVGIPPVSVQGSRLTQAPEFSGNASYSHDFDFESGLLTPELSVNYQSEVILALPSSPINDQKAVAQVNALLTYKPHAAKWLLNLWGKNLTNEVIKAASTGSAINLAPPRTYGATLNVAF